MSHFSTGCWCGGSTPCSGRGAGGWNSGWVTTVEAGLRSWNLGKQSCILRPSPEPKALVLQAENPAGEPGFATLLSQVCDLEILRKDRVRAANLPAKAYGRQPGLQATRITQLTLAWGSPGPLLLALLPGCQQAPSPAGLQRPLLCHLPQSTSDEEKEIIAQVSTHLQLQTQREGCWQGCRPALLAGPGGCHVAGASRQK